MSTSDQAGMIAGALEHFRRRAEERAVALAERRAELRQRAVRAAEALAGEAGVTRVIVFGSVAMGTADERSDIDLAVVGLPATRYFAAAAAASEAAGMDALDLVRWEEAPPSLRERIETDGMVLYDRG